MSALFFIASGNETRDSVCCSVMQCVAVCCTVPHTNEMRDADLIDIEGSYESMHPWLILSRRHIVRTYACLRHSASVCHTAHIHV